MKVLLIEDDKRISSFVVKGLKENGFTVTLAASGEEGRILIQENEWDIILMDIMLPGIDGIQLTRLIRYKNNRTPILIISALGETDDKITALDGGADDYLTKPFHFNELISRINALTRRAKYHFQEKQKIYTCADLRADPDEYTVKRGDTLINLSPREFRLLLFLLENKNKVVSRTVLLSAVWGVNYDHHTNVVDVYISYLRNKIDNSYSHKLIHTVKGAGYSIRE
jgi:two-component system OmpR family response regulator